MFDDLDRTLRKLLDDVLVFPSLAGIDVSFKAPDKDFIFNEPTVNLFLYGVHENRLLRDPEPIIEFIPGTGTFVRRRPPLRVDCDYLVTAWSKKPDAAAVAEEHQILAKALMKLSRFPTVPDTYLQGALIPQPFPIQLWVAQEDDSKSLGEFWSSLGMPPRSSFHLMATITLDLKVQQDQGLPVTTRIIDLDDDLDRATPGELIFAIGGVVRDSGTASPVAGATVTLDGGPTATTDVAGRFTFAGLNAGNHSLDVVAAGLPNGNLAITVPAAAIDDYDIDL